jgi:iron-sulfur cluster assembly protein
MLKISDLAVKEFKTFLNNTETPSAGLHVYLRQGSCCGPSVGLELAEEPVENTTEFDFQGLKVFMLQETADSLNGATIEFVEDPENPGFRLQWEKKQGCGCH